MSDYFSSAEKSALRRLSAYMGTTGPRLDVVFDAIFDRLAGGNVGLESLARDVDGIALGGGSINQDEDATTGVTFGYTAGVIAFGGVNVSVAAGTIALSPNATNYVEVSSAGTVSKNTTGFTAGRARLFKIVTGATEISTVTQAKVLQTVLPPGGITGDLLSAASGTKSIELALGDVSATRTQLVLCPGVAGVISGAQLVATNGVTASDTDYWTFAAINKSQGDNPVLATTAANATLATGGAGLTAYTARALTIHPSGPNLITAAGDVLAFSLTKSGSATTLSGAVVRFDFRVNG